MAMHAFIVACPRSGTSLLRDLLGAHPQIAAFPESHVFAFLESPRPVLRWLRVASRRAPKVLAQFQDQLDHPPRVRAWTPFVRSYSRAFVRLLDDVAGSQGASVWVEKTPRHLNHIELIEREVPEARFVHIVRSGEDVVASLYEQAQSGDRPWWGRKLRTVDDCIDLWKRSLEVTRWYRNRREHLIVSYEELVTDPERVLSVVCEFLGVEFDAVMLKGVELRYEPRAKFFTLFSTDQQSYILKTLTT